MDNVTYDPYNTAKELQLSEDLIMEFVEDFIEMSYSRKDEIDESLAKNGSIKKFYSIMESLLGVATKLKIKDVQETIFKMQNSTERAAVEQLVEIFYEQIDALEALTKSFVQKQEKKVEINLHERSGKYKLKMSYASFKEIEEDIPRILNMAKKSNEDQDWRAYASLVSYASNLLYKENNIDKAVEITEELMKYATNNPYIYNKALEIHALMEKKTNQLDESISIYKKIFERELQNDNRKSLPNSTVRELMSLYIEAGYLEEAESLEENYRNLWKNYEGMDETELNFCHDIDNWANMYEEHNHLYKAIELKEEVLGILINELSEISYDTYASTAEHISNLYIVLLGKLADLYSSTEQADKEIKIFIESVKLTQKLYEKVSIESNLEQYIFALKRLGVIYSYKKQFFEAIGVIEKLYVLTKKLYEKNSLRFAKEHLESVSFLAMLYKAFSMHKECKVLEQEESEICCCIKEENIDE